jgi:hypothetical protein
VSRSFRGRSNKYWKRHWDNWLADAFLSRYGHQDIFKLRGISRPFTVLEKTLYLRALSFHLEKEWGSRDPSLPSED